MGVVLCLILLLCSVQVACAFRHHYVPCVSEPSNLPCVSFEKEPSQLSDNTVHLARHQSYKFATLITWLNDFFYFFFSLSGHIPAYVLHTKNRYSSLSSNPGQIGQSLSGRTSPLAYRFLFIFRLLINIQSHTHKTVPEGFMLQPISVYFCI